MKPNFYMVFAAMAAAFVGCADESIVGGTSVEPNTVADLSSSSEYDAPNGPTDVVLSSSSDNVVEASSSSMFERLSSSEIPMSSSSSSSYSWIYSSGHDTPVLCKTYGGCAPGGGDLWNPPYDGEFVKTGEYADSTWPEGVVADGSWFWELDTADGGKSTLEWPVELGDDGSFLPMIEEYEALRGTFTLDKGILAYDPFVSVGFRIAKDSAGNPVPVDVSNWEGICILYSSTVSAVIELVLSDSLNEALGYALPGVDLVKSYSNSKCFEWGKFRRPTWGAKVDGWEDDIGKTAAKQLVAVRIRFQGKTGKTGEFSINGIGSNN